MSTSVPENWGLQNSRTPFASPRFFVGDSETRRLSSQPGSMMDRHRRPK